MWTEQIPINTIKKGMMKGRRGPASRHSHPEHLNFNFPGTALLLSRVSWPQCSPQPHFSTSPRGQLRQFPHWQHSPDRGVPLCSPLTRDLTDNQLVTLPLDGLAGLTHLKLQGNPALSEPFTKESFPKMRYWDCWLFNLWC